MAVTLSRVPLMDTSDVSSSSEIEQLVQAITATFPASPDCLDGYCKAQAEGSICSKLIQYCTSGWPIIEANLNLLLVALYYCTNPG